MIHQRRQAPGAALVILLLLAAGVAGYFGWREYQVRTIAPVLLDAKVRVDRLFLESRTVTYAEQLAACSSLAGRLDDARVALRVDHGAEARRVVLADSLLAGMAEAARSYAVVLRNDLQQQSAKSAYEEANVGARDDYSRARANRSRRELIGALRETVAATVRFAQALEDVADAAELARDVYGDEVVPNVKLYRGLANQMRAASDVAEARGGRQSG